MQNKSGNGYVENLLAPNQNQPYLNLPWQSLVLLVLKNLPGDLQSPGAFPSKCRHFSLGNLSWYLTFVFIPILLTLYFHPHPQLMRMRPCCHISLNVKVSFPAPTIIPNIRALGFRSGVSCSPLWTGKLG